MLRFWFNFGLGSGSGSVLLFNLEGEAEDLDRELEGSYYYSCPGSGGWREISYIFKIS